MPIKVRSIIKAGATYLPGGRRLSGRTTGGTTSARYCYSVWLRHLSMARQHGLPTSFGTVVELGPGDTLGTGLAALLSGAERYIALDAVRYAEPDRNVQIFEELIGLFRNREPIPDAAELPLVQPRLASYAFPAEPLSSSRLDAALDPARLDGIRNALRSPPPDILCEPAPVCYIAPWQAGTVGTGTADLVFSQTVLEYSDDLGSLYAEMSRWLKPGGLMSHEIDFKSLGITTEWNGHWSCSDALWRVAVGRRRHRINREPCSTHVALLAQANCRVVAVERTVRPSAIPRERLAPRFRHLTDDDLTTSSALIQAVKEEPLLS
jgi:SAM-dependent methyltransferase